MDRRWFFWLLCAMASVLVLGINLSNAIEATHIVGQSRSVEGVVKLLGIDTSKIPSKNGSTVVHSVRLKFIAEDGSSFSLNEYPNRPFKSSNWDNLVEDIKQLTNQRKMKAHCTDGFDGCFIYADANTSNKIWLLLSLLSTIYFSWMSCSSKREHLVKLKSQ